MQRAFGVLFLVAALVVQTPVEKSASPLDIDIPINISPKPKAPEPCPDQEPSKPKRPWGSDLTGAGQPQLGGKVSPDGTVTALDLPETEKKHNTGGRNGAGLCVFTSIEYAARWQNENRLKDFQQKMKQEPGGGWPEKVDKMIAKYGPGTLYIQDTSGDFELIKLAVSTGRMPSVTYDGHDPHYRGDIAHMVSLAWADDTWVAITDNNYPKDNEHVWMSVAEFKKRHDGWSVYLLSPPPPPIPIN